MTKLIYIISNVSDKIERIAGNPYCIVNGKTESIVSDKIKIDMDDNSIGGIIALIIVKTLLRI